uniref:Uncharacterized protein n=1 Tax=Meloidogyne floridensis TaxID=298350 RepID=A0A915PC10_9BILA
MQAGGDEPNVNLNEFSLSELYFLMNILDEIKEDDYKNYGSVRNILNEKGAEILSEHDEIEPNGPFVGNFKRKIRALIKYSEGILNNYEKQIKGNYINLHRVDKLNFINRRISEYKQTVNEEEYNKFIVNHDLDIDEFGDQRDLNNIPVSLSNIR